MFKYLLTLVLLCFSFDAISQQLPADIYGNWVSYEIDMKDGSKLHSTTISDDDREQFSFSAKGMSKGSLAPAGKFPLVGTFKNNIYTLSDFYHYEVERFSGDTLIISERINTAQPDQMLRYHLIRQDAFVSELEKLQGKRDTLRATPYYGPARVNNLTPKIEAALKNLSGHFTIEGTININLLTKTVDTKITKSNTGARKYNEAVAKIFNDSYDNWDLTYLSKYKVIEVPFKYTASGTYGQFQISSFQYYPSDEPRALLPHNAKEGAAYFDLAVDAYSKGNLEKAVANFEKAFQKDNYNIEALYNEAVVLYEQKDTSGACAVWQRLATLGQKRAIDFRAQLCK